jgi:hypothetical protein
LISSLATRAAFPILSLSRWDVRFYTLRSLKFPPEPLKITISLKSATTNYGAKLVTSPLLHSSSQRTKHAVISYSCCPMLPEFEY